jgi:competence protein ComEA
MAPIAFTRRQLLLVGLGLLAVLALAGTRLASSGAAHEQPRAAPLARAGPAASGTEAAARVVVDVVGAVRRPGVYRLPEGARVEDAVRRAGGATRRAAIALVNLAAPLADGMQVVVPASAPGGEGAPGAASGVPGTPGARVSLSSASESDLDELPGIGPVTARKIVEWRAAHGPFRSVEALDAIPGIGPARIEQLRDLVTP